jgi:WD40 repeat protein
MEIDLNIENIIDKNINEIYDTLEKYNHFDNDLSKSLNDSLSNNDSFITYENYSINKSNFTFDQIYSIEKIEDEIWHLEFSITNTFFATCSRNGIISIFKLEINHNNLIKENQEMLIESETQDKNGFNHKENNLINLDNILISNNNKLKTNENALASLTIKCLNNFLSHRKSVTALSWSKNEKHLLTSSTNKEIFLWDPFEGQLIKKFLEHSDIVSSVKWITNDTFVSGSIDKRMRIEHIEKGLVCYETFSRIRKVLISEFYSCIIILPSSMNDIIFYDYKNFREINRITEMDPIISGNISKKDEGKRLIVNLSKVNASINLYEISNMKLINKFYGHAQEQYCIECNFAGEFDEFIICGSEDANIYIWHIADSIPIRIIKGQTGTINSCNLIKILDKNIIFSASDDHTLRIWGAKNINIDFIDNSANRNNKKKNSSKGRFSANSNHSTNAQNHAIFDVVDMSNWGIHNNDVSLNDESREESSDYYVEEEE